MVRLGGMKTSRAHLFWSHCMILIPLHNVHCVAITIYYHPHLKIFVKLIPSLNLILQGGRSVFDMKDDLVVRNAGTGQGVSERGLRGMCDLVPPSEAQKFCIF